MERISRWLRRFSTGWVTLAALALFLLFTALVLPRQATNSAESAGDAGSPDQSFFYTPSDLYHMAEAYGEAGRAAYIRARFTFDVIWPLVYAAFLATALNWVYARAVAPISRWQLVNLVPLLAALFDYLENLATSLVMSRYPAHTPAVDSLAPLFTMTKWILLGGAFLLLIVGAALALWRSIRKHD